MGTGFFTPPPPPPHHPPPCAHVSSSDRKSSKNRPNSFGIDLFNHLNDYFLKHSLLEERTIQVKHNMISEVEVYVIISEGHSNVML